MDTTDWILWAHCLCTVDGYSGLPILLDAHCTDTIDCIAHIYVSISVCTSVQRVHALIPCISVDVSEVSYQ